MEGVFGVTTAANGDPARGHMFSGNSCNSRAGHDYSKKHSTARRAAFADAPEAFRKIRQRFCELARFSPLSVTWNRVANDLGNSKECEELFQFFPEYGSF